MNILKDTSCYLAGPVEHDKRATSWRKKVALKLSKLGVKVFDPLIKPPWLSASCRIDPSVYRRVMDGGESEEGWVATNKRNIPKRLQNLTKIDGEPIVPPDVTIPEQLVWMNKETVISANAEMRKADMRIVSAIDWLICYLPVKFTSGTFEEVYEAIRLGKPVFFCCPNGIPSTWLLAATGVKVHCHETSDYKKVFFKNWSTLLKHVELIDKGRVVLDPFKWIFLTWRKEGWGLPLLPYWSNGQLEYDAEAGHWRKK